MWRLFQFLALLALTIIAAASCGAFDFVALDCAPLRLSFGAWFFFGCCVLHSSPHVCYALSSSVTVAASLIRGLAEMSRDTTVATLRAQIEDVQQADGGANTSSATYQDANQQLRKDYAALQHAHDASQTSIEELHLTINKLNNKVSMYEGHYNVSIVDADRHNSLQCIKLLKKELLVKDDEITWLNKVIQDRREGDAHSSQTISSLARRNGDLEIALEAKSKKANELELIVLQHGRDMYQRDLQVTKFSAFKEILHQMTEAGGHEMVVAVLFVSVLAEKGLDLAELGVDESRYVTYRDYALAVYRGFQSPLLPQGGFRLNGIQYPLSGLRVIGTKVVEAGSCLVVPSSFAPSTGFATFSTPSAPLQHAPKASWPIDQQAPAPFSATSGGFTTLPLAAAPVHNVPEASRPSFGTASQLLQQPANTSAPTFDIAALAASLPSQPANASAPTFDMTALAASLPSQPAQNEEKVMTFQQPKKPGSFGLKGTAAQLLQQPANASAPTVDKAALAVSLLSQRTQNEKNSQQSRKPGSLGLAAACLASTGVSKKLGGSTRRH